MSRLDRRTIDFGPTLAQHLSSLHSNHPDQTSVLRLTPMPGLPIVCILMLLVSWDSRCAFLHHARTWGNIEGFMYDRSRARIAEPNRRFECLLLGSLLSSCVTVPGLTISHRFVWSSLTFEARTMSSMVCHHYVHVCPPMASLLRRCSSIRVPSDPA